MTEIEKQADDFFANEMPSPSTQKVYRAAYRRFQARVPAYAWADVPTILRYKSLMTSSLRGPFGVMFSLLYGKCREWGVPCADPEALRWRIERPCTVAKHIDTLAMFSSYPSLTHLSWNDVSENNGVFYLRGMRMNEAMVDAIVEIGRYYWPDQTPPSDAPLIALSPATARHRLHEDMAEQIVARNARGTAYLVESQFAFQMYPEMYRYKFTQRAMEYVFDQLEKISELGEYAKKNARRTLKGALAALQWGDIAEFNRLMRSAERGIADKRNRTVEESIMSMSEKRSLLPTKAPGLSLSDDPG